MNNLNPKKSSEDFRNECTHEDFDVPGINLLSPWRIEQLESVDPRSQFFWNYVIKDNKSDIMYSQYLSRADYIKELILEKQVEQKPKVAMLPIFKTTVATKTSTFYKSLKSKKRLFIADSDYLK